MTTPMPQLRLHPIEPAGAQRIPLMSLLLQAGRLSCLL
jgi:hypothetical protein